MSNSVGYKFGDWLVTRKNFMSLATGMMSLLSFIGLFVWLKLGYGIGGPVFWLVLAIVSVCAGYVWALLMWHLVFAGRIERFSREKEPERQRQS